MVGLYTVCACFVACQLCIAAHGSALPLESHRRVRSASGENEDSEYHTAENENSQEGSVEEPEPHQTKQTKKQLNKPQQEQSQEQSRDNHDSNERESQQQQEEEKESLDHQKVSQERVQLREDNSRDVEEEKEVLNHQKVSQERVQLREDNSRDEEEKEEAENGEEEEQQKKEGGQRGQTQRVPQQPKAEQGNRNMSDDNQKQLEEIRKDEQLQTDQFKQGNQTKKVQQQILPLQDVRQDEKENTSLKSYEEIQTTTKEPGHEGGEKEASVAEVVQESSEPTAEDYSQQDNDKVTTQDDETNQATTQTPDIQEREQQTQDPEKLSVQEPQENTVEQQSEPQQTQQNQTLLQQQKQPQQQQQPQQQPPPPPQQQQQQPPPPQQQQQQQQESQQNEHDSQGQPSKQQQQYLPQPIESQELRRKPDTQVETQIPPTRHIGLQSAESERQQHIAASTPHNHNRPDEEHEDIQPATTEQQNLVEPNFMITRLIHPNISRPYALRRVNFGRNVTGMEPAEGESRTLLKAALGLLTGLNMGANPVGYDMPSTGKFTASNTMSFLGKIFNTDFSISYGTPLQTHVPPSLYPPHATQVVYSPPLPMDHHRSPSVGYSAPLSIGHSQYYDRQEPQRQEEYISFPPYGKPHPDTANRQRIPEFAASATPHEQYYHPHEHQLPQHSQQHELQELQQQLEAQRQQPQLHPQEKTQYYQQQEQQQLQHHLQLQENAQNYQQQLQQQFDQHQGHPQQDAFQLEQLQLQESERQQHDDHQPPVETLTSVSPSHDDDDDGRHETTVVVDDDTESSGQPEPGTTETPPYSRSEETSDSHVKDEGADKPHEADDEDKSAPRDSGETSIASDEYLDGGSFSEEEIIRRRMKEKRKRKRDRWSRRRHRPRSSHESRYSNESNVGSEDATRYRYSEEESRERRY